MVTEYPSDNLALSDLGSSQFQSGKYYPEYILPNGNTVSLWIYFLPDYLRCLSLQMIEALQLHKPSVTSYGTLSTHTKNILEPALIHINENAYFCKAMLLGEPRSNTPMKAIVGWVLVDQISARCILNGEQPLLDSVCLWSNMIRTPFDAFGLFSMVEIDWRCPQGLPLIRAAHDSWTTSPGLEALLTNRHNHTNQAHLISSINDFERDFPTATVHAIEESFLNKDIDSATQAIKELPASERITPRIQFLLGSLAEADKLHAPALTHYNCAQRNAHPYAFQKELSMHNELTKPLRNKYPHSFVHIDNGEAARALTGLRIAAKKFPVVGNSVLAYCLRHTNEPEEGLAAATTSIASNPLQADTLGHKWLFEVQLALDKNALATATNHLMLYPLDPSANTHCIDSLLLCNHTEDALMLAKRYCTISQSIERTLHYFFKVYEQLEEWEPLAYIFESSLKFLRAPTPETLCKYGDVLTECDRIEEALVFFNRALSAAPEHEKVILGYARTLCRANREAEAEELLETVLADPNRIDSLEGKAFIVTLLAEIRRRTGRASLAITTFKQYISNDLVDISEKVGPLPALEYAESLLELGNKTSARKIVNRLKELWPDEQYVAEMLELLS